MEKTIVRIFILCFGILFLNACQLKKKQEELKQQQVSEKEILEIKKSVELKILRYEQDIFSLDTTDLTSGIARLETIYPDFLIAKNAHQNLELMHSLKLFITDKNTRNIYLYTQKKFSDISALKEQLEMALSYYLHYFPNEKIPTLITMVPGLDIETPSVFPHNNYLIINLDMYMGADCDIYPKVDFPKYISDRLEPKYIPVHIFTKALVYRHLPTQLRNTFLENMIYEGKKLVFAEMMLPELQPQQILEYTNDQYEWLKQNTGKIWLHYLDNNLLFSTDKSFIARSIQEAPFTKPFGRNCPGRAGSYIGWKIVREYLKNNPEIGLKELLQEIDAQKILSKSKFKPKI